MSTAKIKPNPNESELKELECYWIFAVIIVANGFVISKLHYRNLGLELNGNK